MIGVWTRRLTNQWDGASLVRATWISIQCPSAGRGTNQTSPSRMWRQGCPPYTCRSDIRYPVRSGNAPIVSNGREGSLSPCQNDYAVSRKSCIWLSRLGLLPLSIPLSPEK